MTAKRPFKDDCACFVWLSMQKSLSIRIRKADRTVIVDLEGTINLFSSPELRSTLLAQIDGRKRPEGIVLNLLQVDHIDSSGLATFIEGLQESRRKGIKYSLYGLSPIVRSVFELAKLASAFPIHKDEEEALQSLK